MITFVGRVYCYKQFTFCMAIYYISFSNRSGYTLSHWAATRHESARPIKRFKATYGKHLWFGPDMAGSEGSRILLEVHLTTLTIDNRGAKLV